MELNSKLTAYGDFPNVKRFNTLLDKVESQFKEIGALQYSVALEKIESEKGPLSLMKLNAKWSSSPDAWMTVKGRHNHRDFELYLPMNNGSALPYLLQLELDVQYTDTAVFKRGFLGGKWVLESGDKARAKQLGKLNLPSVNWSQSKGEDALFVTNGFTIGAHPEKKKKSLWSIHSANQGFVVGVGPKVAQYFKAAPKLEAFLKQWMYEGSSIKM